MGTVRILGGLYANRNITFIDNEAIRPTGVRVRQVLFDWLRFIIKDKKCIDLFAGSGILGFEALSQGAQSVFSVDSNYHTCQQIQKEALRINAQQIVVSCQSIPFSLDDKFDICFMDPPFEDTGLYQETIAWLVTITKEDALIYIEANQQLGHLEGMVILKSKKVASVWMHLYQRVAT